MKKLILAALLAASSLAHAADIITVYKSAHCSCCKEWIAHMREAGFEIKTVDTDNLGDVKARLGVPTSLASCHTGVIESTGQVIEGHVPAAAVRKLIATPQVHGVAVPGMPMDSPGMGAMDGNLVTVDLDGKPFSKD